MPFAASSGSLIRGRHVAPLPPRLGARFLQSARLHVSVMETARLELPFVANLDVFVVVPAGAAPLKVVASDAQIEVAAAGRAPAALQLDHVVVDIRPWRGRGEAFLERLEQVGASGVAAFLLLQVDDRECAVLGKDVGDSFDIAAPYAVAIFERQFANRFAIGQLGYCLFDTFRHGSPRSVLGSAWRSGRARRLDHNVLTHEGYWPWAI